MFGSFNIGTDYTFTQSETQNKAVSKTKLNSSYFGDGAVSGKSDLKPEAKIAAPEVSDVNNNSPSVEDNKGNDYKLLSNKTSASIANSFDALAAAVGGVGGRVTKDQLISYLHSLTSDPSVSAENVETVTFLKGLIAQFDTLSGNGSYITSLAGAREPQDYTTVTVDQVTSPIDVRV